jgi:hypothetical protein
VIDKRHLISYSSPTLRILPPSLPTSAKNGRISTCDLHSSGYNPNVGVEDFELGVAEAEIPGEAPEIARACRQFLSAFLGRHGQLHDVEAGKF